MADSSDDLVITFDSRQNQPPFVPVAAELPAILPNIMPVIPPILHNARFAEAMKRAMLMQQSVFLQAQLVQGAEDLPLISDLLILKDEVIQYTLMKAEHEKSKPKFPAFYGTSVVYLFKIIVGKRLRPVYINCIGDLILMKLREAMPQHAHEIEPPNMPKTFQEYIYLDDRTVDDRVEQREKAHDAFEKVFGEVYLYISLHIQKFGCPPNPRIKFLNQLLFLFAKMGFIVDSNNTTFIDIFIDRLKRNLVAPAEFFDALKVHITTDFMTQGI